MKKLGILGHQITKNQKNICMIHNINKLCIQNRDIDCIFFYNDLGISEIKHEFASMSSISALNYDGVLVAIDPIMAQLLTKCMTATKKYFYIWNIDWYLSQKTIDVIQNIYLNKHIELIARSESHAAIISRVFKKPKYIIEEFDYEQLQNII